MKIKLINSVIKSEKKLSKIYPKICQKPPMFHPISKQNIGQVIDIKPHIPIKQTIYTSCYLIITLGKKKEFVKWVTYVAVIQSKN